jgi:GT2 family glycosyltransferase
MNNRTPTIDVVTVPWNHKKFMEPLFQGLQRVDYPPEAWTMHFVDNASADGTADEIRRLMTSMDGLPRIVLHEPGKNLGFSGGNNLVMRDSKADYLFLLNPDAIFEKETLKEVVAVAEAHQNAGTVQPILVLAQNPNEINSIGNDIHFAGFGYCRGYHQPVSSAPKEVTMIGYPSGAGVLIRRSVMEKIGLLDETLFAFHEDTDFGWRVMLAGFDNILAPKSILRHHYEFSRSIAKWFWIERNRWIIMLTNYRIGTLLLTMPALIAIEIATWLFAMKGGWTKEKWKAVSWFLKASSWKDVARMRRDRQQIRTRSDREILKRFVSDITYQEVTNGFMERVANPLMRLYFMILKVLVVW